MGKVAKIVLFGSLGVIACISALQAIGSSIEADFAAQSAGAPESTTDAPPSTTALPPAANAAPPPKPKPIKLSDLDESDRAIRLAINQSGHLCARPIQVQEAGTGLYGVQCITNRDGTGLSNYLVNSRTNEVQEI